MTKEEFERLKRRVEYFKTLDDKDVKLEELKDIRDVKIDTPRPLIERILSFLIQMDGNPYIFKVEDTPVRVSFNDDGPSLQECLVNMFTEHKSNDIFFK